MWLRRQTDDDDNRVNCGGGWNNNANNCKAGNRNRNNPENRNNNLGFRLASGSTAMAGNALQPPPKSCSRPSGGTKEGKQPVLVGVGGHRAESPGRRLAASG